ncbi:MAG: FAD-dependent thymidylate synthase [Smithellaceae bacterium]|nr:FAD-dependent thymidylate synthase [Smithellaceae bacterium]
MKVLVAGFNVDRDSLEELALASPGEIALTPETIPAAYARISRDPRPVNELRQQARQELERVRQSNRTIVFEMGHSSIAEHAVFNLDIIGVSRLLAEEIEKFRLVSYTEKSQRYVLLTDDFVLPEEIAQTGLAGDFRNLIARQNRLYNDLYLKLRDLIIGKYPSEALRPNSLTTLEGWAKEDARYILALATETQLGMTINARSLELMLRRLAAHPWQEARSLAEQLYQATYPIAPSLIRYAKATDYDRLTRAELADSCRSWRGGGVSAAVDLPGAEEVVLISATPGGDDRVLAALIHSSTQKTLSSCLSLVEGLDRQAKVDLFKTACRHMKAYDPVLREFEYGDFLFEVTISASCYAQLKRHRMTTITCQDYDPNLGVTIPPGIAEAGLPGPFLEMVKETEELYRRIEKVTPTAAGYILTNAHRRRVALKVNARELYHMARLRADRHAQWDIRQLVEKMLCLAREAMPLTMFLAAGKDDFSRLYEGIYGNQP